MCLILGIETSCDETSSAVVKDGRAILSNVILSQIDIHKEYGGVVPEIASRNHIDVISYVVDKAISDAKCTFSDIDAVAVTYGPGLVGALLCGVSYAKALSYAINKPLIGVHHIKGHIAANYLEYKHLEPPFIAVVVSGGHSHVMKVRDYDQFDILAKTFDDAAGEAFDKVARVMGLPYPGGKLMDDLAKLGDEYAIDFPSPLVNNGFSFSGLKTAAINYIRKTELAYGNITTAPDNACLTMKDLSGGGVKQKKQSITKADIAASLTRGIVDALVSKTIDLAKRENISKVVLAGGVASNSFLRGKMKQQCEKNTIELFVPSPILCTDNAAMIASFGYYEYLAKHFKSLKLNAVPYLEIDCTFSE